MSLLPFTFVFRNVSEKTNNKKHDFMENILDDIYDFDEESKRILRGSRIIQLAELEKGIYGSGIDPFEGIRTNKTFDEISNEYALSTPFGKKASFINPQRKITMHYLKTFIQVGLITSFLQKI